ncbi:MAG: putative hydrolase of the superfamily [Thermoleophilaceae bacterium]|nr:putative hydrolase of the superfamily [Thermoleophilaceae bacterium]
MDFGGVLTTNVFDSFKDFCVAEGLEPDAVKRLFREDPEALGLLRQLERGEVERGRFSELFAPILGITDHEGLVERLFAGMVPDHAMLDAVEKAHDAGIRTGLISNSWGEGHYDRDMLPGIFDGIVISGDVGMHKPNADIYLLGAERAGAAPEDCVFVDDLRENCAGAEAVGMTAILHRGAQGTLPELERLLGVTLST